jgi:Phosphate transport regulator (distant homolog of PhoU)
MAKTKGNDYFKMLADMVECSCRAATLLEAILSDFSVDNISENLTKIHLIENEGDTSRHAMVENLVKEFITPIEREDIMALTNQVDNVTDTVEDVLIKIYMYNVTTIQEDALKFTGLVTQCCKKLHEIFEEFGNFKKSKSLHSAIVELNRLEEEGDKLYIEAVRKLYTSDMDAKDAAAWTEIYNCLEKVCDTCEHTADMVENTIMKNS